MVFDTEPGKLRAGGTGGAAVSVVRFTPDSKGLIVANSEHVVQQWDVAAAKLARTLEKADKAAQPQFKGFHRHRRRIRG